MLSKAKSMAIPSALKIKDLLSRRFFFIVMQSKSAGHPILSMFHLYIGTTFANSMEAMRLLAF